ncbi:class E sortase [Actinomadura craniellae]|uniref:class E sortase n=1 Tax=Actinomadura craniellae TaxID=2231787 RepID=UPI0022787211|nr:class E sortase [Actinomadura craniellae]
MTQRDGVGPLHVFGEIVLTLGLVLLLFAGYEFYGKAWAAEQEQDRLDADLDRRWAAGPPVPGQPASRLHIPRLDRHWVVTLGVTQAALAHGPGHYPRSEDPGEVGNVAIAGHRMRSVFWDLDRLRTGDPVVVETRTGWFVYRVVRLAVVRPDQIEVVAPNPDKPKARPRRRLLTLTTCHPRFQNRQRLIVRAELAEVRSKKAGRPAALA